MDVGMQKSNLNPKLNELSNFRSEFSSPTKITLTLKNLPPQLLALSSNKIINTNIGDQGSFTFSPDGKTLAVNKSVNESTPFEVYDLSNGNKIINTNMGDQGSFTFSPDGKTLAVNKSVNESTPFEVYDLSSF
jgi:Tol biopolymer transport system component